MAWLESTGGMFRIGFRFGGRKFHLPLNTLDRQRGRRDARPLRVQRPAHRAGRHRTAPGGGRTRDVHRFRRETRETPVPNCPRRPEDAGRPVRRLSGGLPEGREGDLDVEDRAGSHRPPPPAPRHPISPRRGDAEDASGLCDRPHTGGRGRDSPEGSRDVHDPLEPVDRPARDDGPPGPGDEPLSTRRPRVRPRSRPASRSSGRSPGGNYRRTSGPRSGTAYSSPCPRSMKFSNSSGTANDSRTPTRCSSSPPTPGRGEARSAGRS